jgi:hypothetical protein
MSQTKSTQQTTTQTQAKNIDFSHRVFSSPSGDTSESLRHLHLVDTIDSMANRATSLLDLLAFQFTEEENRANDEILFHVIDAAAHEVRDIKAVINAFAKELHALRQNQQA